MAEPLISVIIPCYNQAVYLPDAVRSVQSQTLSNWECIVVNDGSPDDTEAVAAKLAANDSRIRIVSQENAGLAAARNRGLQNACGKIIQFLDADDLVESEKLSRQSAYLAEHSQVGLVYGDVRYFPSDQPTERRFTSHGPNVPWMRKISGSGRVVLSHLVWTNVMAVNCPLVRRTVCEDVGSFDTSLAALEDWDYWQRCAMKGTTFAFVDAPLTRALVRVHELNMTQDSKRMRTARQQLHVKSVKSLCNPQIYAQLRPSARRFVRESLARSGAEPVPPLSCTDAIYRLARAGLHLFRGAGKADSR